MISRRTAFKSISLLTGVSVLSSLLPMTGFASILNRKFADRDNKRQRVVLVGSKEWIQPYTDFIKENNEKYELVFVVPYVLRKNKNLKISHNINHPFHREYKKFLISGLEADIVVFTGFKDTNKLATQALKKGYNVWADRPYSRQIDECLAVNENAKQNMCSAKIAHIIEGELCLMENKHYSA